MRSLGSWFLDDVTNGVGETFLAQSLQCARCHDHKFDPIPTHDYYSVQAVFATTQLSERAAAFLPVENTQGFEEKKYLEPRRAEYLATLQRLDEMLVKHAERWFVEKGIDPTKWIQAIAQAGPPQRGAKRRDFNGVFDSARNALTKQGVPEDQFPPKFYGFRPEDYGNERVARKGLERLKWELERYEPFAFAVYNGRTPQLTSVSAPLRIWLWHFDQAIAGNPNNFVSTGKKPTHPELLDWLAATFVEQGWSFKALHRSIMNSEAYRRSARHPDPKSLVEKDPTGSSYAVFKPRRLTAEELRDAMLTATGELNLTLGGIPNRPEINLEAALQPRQVMGTFAAAWIPNPLPQQRHRRSLYALKVRGLPDPLQEIFNAPAPDFSCERREASTVTPQVFSLFNGQTTHSRALALANRSVKETKSDDEALTHIFQLVFSRPPQPSERQHCLAHWREIESLISNEIPPTQKPPLEVRRDAVEENTGEKFSFNEKLHANTEFVSDLQPADVPTHTRALADVCLALLNANEFAYVY